MKLPFPAERSRATETDQPHQGRQERASDGANLAPCPDKIHAHPPLHARRVVLQSSTCLLRLRPGAQKSREIPIGDGRSPSTPLQVRHADPSGPSLQRGSRGRFYTFNLPDEVGKGEYGILPPNQGGKLRASWKKSTPSKIIE